MKVELVSLCRDDSTKYKCKSTSFRHEVVNFDILRFVCWMSMYFIVIEDDYNSFGL